MYSVNGFSHVARISNKEAEISALRAEVAELKAVGSTLVSILQALGYDIDSIAHLVLCFQEPKPKMDPVEVYRSRVLESILVWFDSHPYATMAERKHFASDLASLYPQTELSTASILGKISSLYS